MASSYLTPEQQKQLAPTSSSPTPAPAAPAPAPSVPPNPLAGIGYAIGKQKASTPAQPVAYNGGYYNPTTAPFGFDMTTPGVKEQMWNNNQNLWFQSPQLDWVDNLLPQFQDPWQGEKTNEGLLSTIANPGAGQQYWAGIQGSANTPTGAEKAIAAGYKGPNNAQTAFDMTKGRIPDSFQPQFDAYYDRMKNKVMSDVNSQSAARGAYGSNTALNGSVGAGLDVEAQRAKALTDFMFKNSEDQRAWMDSLSNQGRTADLSGLDIFGANEKAAQYGLDKTKTLGDLAFKAEDENFNKQKTLSDIAFGMDQDKLTRLTAGANIGFGSDLAHRGRLQGAFNEAGEAQNAHDTRINNLQGALAGFSNDVQNFMTQNYDKLLGGDQQMSDQEIEAMIAETADERGWTDQERERFSRDLKGAMEAASDAKQAGLF
jgi:hypothetical protein